MSESAVKRGQYGSEPVGTELVDDELLTIDSPRYASGVLACCTVGLLGLLYWLNSVTVVQVVPITLRPSRVTESIERRTDEIVWAGWVVERETSSFGGGLDIAIGQTVRFPRATDAMRYSKGYIKSVSQEVPGGRKIFVAIDGIDANTIQKNLAGPEAPQLEAEIIVHTSHFSDSVFSIFRQIRGVK